MLLAAILLCASGLALLVYRYDMYEREPWYMLLLALALGAAASTALSFGEDLLLQAIPDGERSLAAQAGVAAVAEELAKLSIVLAIWFAMPWHFNDPFDGLIYGALAGLGFAVEESIFYINMPGSAFGGLVVAGRESVRLMLHLLLGGLTCVGLGLARFRIRRWPAVLAGGMSASMAIHFAWDYCCGLPAALETVPSVGERIISVALMLAALVLFAAAVVFALKHSGDTHAPHRHGALWGWPFTRRAKPPKTE